jgi:hypothetical protein
MFRIQQAALIVSTLLFSWLLMQAVHEFGHMAAAWISGGRVVHEVLYPFAISRTEVQPNPHPSIVVWGGPLFGVLFPLMTYGLFLAAHFPHGFLRFFAGFCLIANGAYIGIGSFQRIGDCKEMLRYGSPIWVLWLFGLISISLGLWLWNGIREYFSLRKNDQNTIQPVTSITITLSTIVVILELILSPQR